MTYARSDHAALFEDIDWLLQFNMHPSDICKSVGVGASGITRRARLNGRPDLLEIFETEYLIQRGRRSWDFDDEKLYTEDYKLFLQLRKTHSLTTLPVLS